MYRDIEEPQYAREEYEYEVWKPLDLVSSYYDGNDVLRKRTYSPRYDGCIEVLEIFNSDGYQIYLSRWTLMPKFQGINIYKTYYDGSEDEHVISQHKEELFYSDI